MERHRFTADLWAYDGPGGWHFATVPAELSEDLRDLAGPPAGFGSVRVEVTVGASTWRTSVFPDKATGCFVLPVKKPVRRAESLEIGDRIRVSLVLLTGTD